MHIIDLRRIDLNLLILFEILMEERNVSRAADRAALSQSAMSHALARLREMLEDPVLVRTKNGMEPTDRAKQLRGPVIKALTELGDSLLIQEHFDPLSDDRCFTLVATDYVESLLMPPLLRRLSEEGPHIHLAIKKINPANMVALEDGSFDFFIGRAPKRKNYLNSVHLFDDSYCTIASFNHPGIRKKMTLKRFLSCAHVVLSPGEESQSIVDQVLAKQQLKRKISCSTPYVGSIASLVSQSSMIATIPRRMMIGLDTSASLKQWQPPIKLPPFSIHLSWHERKHYDNGHRWLKGVIIDVATELSR